MQDKLPNPSHPSMAHTVVVGGGTMGADVVVVLARSGARVTVVEPHPDQAARLMPRITAAIASRDSAVHSIAIITQLLSHRHLHLRLCHHPRRQ